jgi:hypothetical protein
MDMKRYLRRAWKVAKKTLSVFVIAAGGAIIALALQTKPGNLGLYIAGFAVLTFGATLRNRWER